MASYFRPRCWRALVLPCLGVLCGVLTASVPPAQADDVTLTVDQVLARSAEDLNQGRPSEAIRTLEAVADRGASHPELSFNRGIGYLRRAKTPAAQPGDLGQAAAAFAEVLGFRPNDAEAERGLLEAQLLVAKKKSQADTSSENHSLGLLERVLLRISPLVLLFIGGAGSLVLCAAIFLRRSSLENRRVAGSIAALVGALLLIPACGLFFVRSALFDDARVGVVISNSAQLIDSGGARMKRHLPLREGTIVYVKSSTSGLLPLVGLAPALALGETAHVSSARLRLLQSNTR